jgi:hypothetical protein
MKHSVFLMVAIFLLLILSSCSEEKPVQPEVQPESQPQISDLILVSGDNQQGKVGQMLAEPFVVRVIDNEGHGVGNVEVHWTVSSGEGALQGLWEGCYPILSISTLTDIDGRAQISLMPALFDTVTVHAEVAVPGISVAFTADASDPSAKLTLVSGNNRNVLAGFVARNQIEPFVVGLIDGEGNPVQHAAVEWNIESGHGSLRSPGDCSFRTNAKGEAAMVFDPRSMGMSVISASLYGVSGPPVEFDVEAEGVAIGLVELEVWWDTYTSFVGFDYNPLSWPGFPNPTVVSWRIGGTVEFRNEIAEAHIISTEVPPGGTSFDSGTLIQGGRFSFVPDAAGTWEFLDTVSGARGWLTTIVIISFEYDPWFDVTYFKTSGIPTLGMAVEFLNNMSGAHIVSTSTPPGGEPFDSGMLNEDERFQFVPNVQGTWEYVDKVSGITGSFTVR